MAKLRELSLKVLWIYNCNEAEIALDFQLEKDGIFYQVKGNGPGAFNSNDELRVCQANNIENISFVSPDQKIFIKQTDKLQQIWDYWEQGVGEGRYKIILKQLEKFREEQDDSLLEQTNRFLKVENVDLSKKQIFDLVFEIETIIGMLKAIKGQVNNDQIQNLITNATAGFSDKSVKDVLIELKRKKIID